ncbi:hypothetical protein MBLNU459_g6734t1 [Dothideomycetes sp. NU459]
MRCRAECCRRAASRILPPRAPHVWVADDDLAHAFARFVSLSGTPRRHGSSVPGPLESRRRLAKRRMMGFAAAAPPPPMPDFGSLFGTTPIDVPALWRAPAASRTPESAFARPPLYGPVPRRRSEPDTRIPPRRPRRLALDDYAALLDNCTDASRIAQLHASLHPDGDVPVAFSQAVLHHLLARIPSRAADTKTLAAEHFHPVVRFLQQDLNNERAHNTHAYLVWLSARPISTDTFRELVTVVADKMLLGTIDLQELRAIFKDLPTLLKSGVSHSDRDRALLHAYTTITDIISDVYVLRADPHLCHALLGAASALSPSHQAVPLIFKAFDWLPKHEQHLAIPIIGESLYVWARRIARNNPIQEPPAAEASPNPLMAFLNALPQGCAALAIKHATLRLVSFVKKIDTSAETSGTDFDVKQRILYWLYLLRRCNHLRHQPYNASIWVELYPLLAEDFTFKDLAAHFASMSPSDAARLILQHWISPSILNKAELRYAGGRRAHSIDYFRDYGVSYTVSRSITSEQGSSRQNSTVRAIRFPHEARRISSLHREPTDLDATAQAVNSAFEARLSNYVREDEAVTAPFADLIAVLYENQVDSRHHLDEIFQLLIQYHSPATIFTFFMKLAGKNGDGIYIHPGVALALVHFFLDTKNHRYAFSVFKACPGVWPSLCPELLFALIDNQAITTETLFKILNRPEFTNSIPATLRTESNNSLSLERVNLIHQMAYALACSPHLTSPQAFRRVQDCLHYLEDRKAPLSDLMSRALVTAGVTRYLQAGEWVSTARFTWILPYVRRLEGDDVADTLDQVTFQWRDENMRGRLQPHSQFQSSELARAKLEADRKAWEFRRTLGHDSKRWKRRQRSWRPWLADGKQSDSQAQQQRSHVTSCEPSRAGETSPCAAPEIAATGVWKPWIEEDENATCAAHG